MLLLAGYVNETIAEQDTQAPSSTIENILPRPRKIERLKEGFVITSETAVYYNAGEDKNVQFAVERFAELMEEKFRLPLQTKTLESLKTCQILVTNKKNNPSGWSNISPKLETAGEEAYELVVRENGVRITGNTAKGLLWGLMTLTQLGQEKSNKELFVPGVRIMDWPHYRWRGYMLDTGRSPFSAAQIKRTIRICSAFKLNFLMLREGDDELNAFKYNHLPLGQKNPYALSLAELADIIDYGEKHGIVVFPEIESLGHASAKRLHYPDLLEGNRHEEYWSGFTHFKKSNFRVGHPGAYKLLEAIYDELFPLLKQPMVHLGLDEVFLSEEKQAEHMALLLPIVDKVGRKYGHKMEMIVWSDAPPTPPEYHSQVIRCLWIYGGDITLDNKFAQKQGIGYLTEPGCKQKVFMSGGSGALHKPYSKSGYRGAFKNLASWAMLGEKYPNFIGLLAVEWASNIIDEWFPNFLMAADFGWNVPEEMPDYEHNMRRIATNLQTLKDFVNPEPAEVDRPAWDGIWLSGRYWEEDIITGQKAAPVVEILPHGGFFHNKSMPIKIESNFPDAKIYYTLDSSEPTCQSNLYLEPFYIDTTTTVKTRAFIAGRPPSYIITQVFGSLDFQDAPAHEQLKPELHYDYYQTFAYSVLNLRSRKITSSGTIDKFRIAPCANGEEEFGFIIKGYIDIKKEGVYTFFIKSNDGSKLYVNGKELVDNDGRHKAIEKSGKIALRVGKHPITVEYFQNGGGQALVLSWEGPGFKKQEIPSEVLFH
jgi:phage pi2 protein 07